MKRLKKIRIPSILASPEPFRLIKRSEEDIWDPTIENINMHTYDYVKLHRFSGTLNIGLPENHLLGVTFDGSFILPAIPEFRNIHNAVDKFNDFFGRLLLGGIYIRAIDATYLQKCLVYYENWYFKNLDVARNSFVELKNAFRHKHSSVKENIILYNTDHILFEDLSRAFLIGDKYFNLINNLTPSILVKGVSAYINNSYSESLIYNWVSIEQLIDYIWDTKFVDRKPSTDIFGRKEFLNDSRTWPSSARIEMFYQKELINEELYNQLSTIRKARNKFVHTGKTPLKEDADIAYHAFFWLLSLIQSEYSSDSLFDELKRKYSDLDPIKRAFYDKRPKGWKNVQFWYGAPIPEIPGDDKWDGSIYKYPIGFEFENVPG